MALGHTDHPVFASLLARWHQELASAMKSTMAKHRDSSVAAGVKAEASEYRPVSNLFRHLPPLPPPLQPQPAWLPVLHNNSSVLQKQQPLPGASNASLHAAVPADLKLAPLGPSSDSAMATGPSTLPATVSPKVPESPHIGRDSSAVLLGSSAPASSPSSSFEVSAMLLSGDQLATESTLPAAASSSSSSASQAHPVPMDPKTHVGVPLAFAKPEPFSSLSPNADTSSTVADEKGVQGTWKELRSRASTAIRKAFNQKTGGQSRCLWRFTHLLSLLEWLLLLLLLLGWAVIVIVIVIFIFYFIFFSLFQYQHLCFFFLFFCVRRVHIKLQLSADRFVIRFQAS